MERSKEIARQFFTELGFQVVYIPEADAKRADLEVDDGLNQYLVEVKEKSDTGSQLTLLSSCCPNSDLKITREPHTASNRLDGILKHADKQLAATPACDAALRLIFMIFKGPDADMSVRRSLHTFYGVQYVKPVLGDAQGVPCAYFDNSFSFSSPNVDGLLLMENDDGRILCLNEFSPRCDALRHSRLAQKIEELGLSMLDPASFDHGHGIALRSTISRTNQDAVLDELERISGVRYILFPVNRYMPWRTG